MRLRCARDRWVLLAGVLFLASPAVAADPPRAPESWRYGINDDYGVTSPVALQKARDAGFGWVLYVLYWNVTNPTNNDCTGDGIPDPTGDCNLDWTAPDTEIQRLAELGFNIFVRIAFPPTWTTGATHPNEQVPYYCYSPTEPDNLRKDDPDNCQNTERRPGFRATPPPGYDRSQDFRTFAEIAVRRYKDRVRAWGFGTEVHSRVFWQGSIPQFFDEIVRPGYEVTKAIDPSLLVVGPDEDVEWSFDELLNLELTRGVRVFDVLSYHVLRQSGWVDISTVDERLKPLIEAHRRGRPFWLTELGFPSSGGISDDIARGWLEEMLAGIRARPWIDKTFIYRLKNSSSVDFGLLDEADQPKPAFEGVSNFLAQQGTPRFYYLAEGATKSFFDLDIAIANPNDRTAPIKVSFFKPDGTVILSTNQLLPYSRHTWKIDTFQGLENTDVSTVVESTTGLPLAVERTMFWDGSAYGGHTDTAVQSPATKWYFAEGSQGFFDTYVLLANSNVVTANVTVTFLLENTAPFVTTVQVGPTARGGFCTCEYSELQLTSFGIIVESDQPIIAERAMYFGSNPFWTAGHESAGVTAPSTSWFLAEGRTGPVFDEWVLISNPNDEAAAVDVQFVTSSGEVVTYPGSPILIEGKRRFTIYVDGVPGLADVAVSTKISADRPVVAERAMYWPGTPGEWYEAHNSFGLTDTGTKWALAEGRAGLDRRYETYILVYNTTNEPAQVTVSYMIEHRGFHSGPLRITRTMGPGRTDVVDWLFDPRLADALFGAVIESDKPIVVERAMYWRGGGRPWGWGGTNATAVKLQ